jgi:hypothetical protein
MTRPGRHPRRALAAPTALAVVSLPGRADAVPSRAMRDLVTDPALVVAGVRAIAATPRWRRCAA